MAEQTNITYPELLHGLEARRYSTAIRSGYCLIRLGNNPMAVVATIRFYSNPPLISFQSQYPITGFRADDSFTSAEVESLWRKIQEIKAVEAKGNIQHIK